ncbi:MAG: HAD-IIIC family phosphatase [Desulfovibrionaceae bacterium]
MDSLLRYPFDPLAIIRKKKSLKRALLEKNGLLDKRVAILGGSTTFEIKEILELFLLDLGIRPTFYESEYNKFYEDVVFPNPELEAFAPDVAFIHTTQANVTRWPAPGMAETEVDALYEAECAKLAAVWDGLREKYGCAVIQNNFDLPPVRPLGNLDCVNHAGRTRLVLRLNEAIAARARADKAFCVHDINHLSAFMGLEKWYDPQFWYAYKYALSYEAIPTFCHNLAAIIGALWGKNKKCLVLDLDNTLWGGVIGDDGVNGIQLGTETAQAEAYSDFQGYLKELKARGVMLTVCSKNEPESAREGLGHPDAVLREDDFTMIKANWMPKPDNIQEIIATINIGIDSAVFVDDNPAEREIVRSQLPLVAVPEMGNDVARYIRILEGCRYFETVSLSEDDLKRVAYYAANAKRQDVQSRFENYGDFLRSLEMTAEIRPFEDVYLDRITQLTNKTNQFNLTTRRYTMAEITAVAASDAHVAIYGRLVDKFGDNGLIAVVIGAQRGDALHIDLWLMSCRVLKRNMEQAMFDSLVRRARERGVRTIHGHYYATPKNKMVAGHYESLGFSLAARAGNGDSEWIFTIPDDFTNTNDIIQVTE